MLPASVLHGLSTNPAAVPLPQIFSFLGGEYRSSKLFSALRRSRSALLVASVWHGLGTNPAAVPLLRVFSFLGVAG